MIDLFDNVILCKECGKKMQKIFLEKNGFKIRAVQCPECHKKIMHPADIEEYKRFSNLKQREFHVKLRMVGNSYAVSIPHEIINFLKESEEIEEKMKRKMQRMVTLAMEEFGKLSLMFGEESAEEGEEKERLIKKEYIRKR